MLESLLIAFALAMDCFAVSVVSGVIIRKYEGRTMLSLAFFFGLFQALMPLIGWFLTVVYGFLVYFLGGYRIRIDSQYLYLSMFFSYAALFPDQQVLLFFFIPIRMKYLALIDAAYFVLAVVFNPFPFNLLPVVAVLNFVIFFAGTLMKNLPRRPSRATINFRPASRKIRQEQREQLYHHKFSFCGRTDTEYPGLEFRYCSRCVGYHCFCVDHINNHIHFTE